ncbi:outer membrane beta-barrel protein [Ferruginibacter sp. SUN106]|uniref:outer membrane beta-barrel protein n=1 Tax=Ferruginibacter sp. SUN106 TaxID=2978348 RepID=UPI003D363F8A
MKKYIIITILIFLFSDCTAQKDYHNFFIGSNYTTTDLSIPNSANNYKIGLNVGYKYVQTLFSSISVSAGLEFKIIQSKFLRQHYDNSAIILDPRSVSERIKISRLIIPLQAYYNFVNKKKSTFYIMFGTEIILLNKADRTVDYYIPISPGGLVKGTYTGKQTIKFGENNKSIGTTFMSGIGSAFEIKDRNFTVELSFCSDISKNKFLTLHNIESDSYFFTKFKSLQLTAGTSFSFRNKKK